MLCPDLHVGKAEGARAAKCDGPSFFGFVSASCILCYVGAHELPIMASLTRGMAVWPSERGRLRAYYEAHMTSSTELPLWLEPRPRAAFVSCYLNDDLATRMVSFDFVVGKSKLG
jgi:hypothetical protein